MWSLKKLCTPLKRLTGLGAEDPPLDHGYMFLPCIAGGLHYHEPSSDMYRAAIYNLEQEDYTVFRSPLDIPENLPQWGCLLRVAVRTDVDLDVQIKDILDNARRKLHFLLQTALELEQAKSAIVDEDGLP